MVQVNACLRCGRTEQEVPILEVFFKGNETAVCTSCLPVLIHRPHELAGKLEGAEELSPSEHDHD